MIDYVDVSNICGACESRSCLRSGCELMRVERLMVVDRVHELLLSAAGVDDSCFASGKDFDGMVSGFIEQLEQYLYGEY